VARVFVAKIRKIRPRQWQQRDGSLHCLYHNGRGKYTNHGLHAFSVDGRTWHKAPDALLPACAQRAVGVPISPAFHRCSVRQSPSLNWQTRPAQLINRLRSTARNALLVLNWQKRPWQALYTNEVILDDGTTITLSGRERPALLFDEATGAPTVLYNGAISSDHSVPWYAMAQRIRSRS
jgi:hypothetical protein